MSSPVALILYRYGSIQVERVFRSFDSVDEYCQENHLSRDRKGLGKFGEREWVIRLSSEMPVFILKEYEME